MSSIGERLVITRQKLGFSQKEFAEMIGVSQGALSGMEKNSRGIPMEAIIELAKYSKQNKNISCDWILTGEAAETSLTDDEQELLSNYRHLDNRGKHKLHTVIYDELDRIEGHKTAAQIQSAG